MYTVSSISEQRFLANHSLLKGVKEFDDSISEQRFLANHSTDSDGNNIIEVYPSSDSLPTIATGS